MRGEERGEKERRRPSKTKVSFLPSFRAILDTKDLGTRSVRQSSPTSKIVYSAQFFFVRIVHSLGFATEPIGSTSPISNNILMLTGDSAFSNSPQALLLTAIATHKDLTTLPSKPGEFNAKILTTNCQEQALRAAIVDLLKEAQNVDPSFGIMAWRDAKAFPTIFSTVGIQKESYGMLINYLRPPMRGRPLQSIQKGTNFKWRIKATFNSTPGTLIKKWTRMDSRRFLLQISQFKLKIAGK